MTFPKRVIFSQWSQHKPAKKFRFLYTSASLYVEDYNIFLLQLCMRFFITLVLSVILYNFVGRVA